LQWYLKAANHGDVDAYLRLSELYQYGGGVPKDLVKAYQWAFIAAKKEGFFRSKGAQFNQRTVNRDDDK